MDERAAELEWSVHAEQVRIKTERDEARALLRECHAAIWKAMGSEDGLDGGEGEPIVRRIEAMMPDLQLPPDTPAI